MFDAPLIGPMVLNNPACVMQEVVDQKKLDTFYMKDTAGGVDEIRIGTSMHSVLMGTKQQTK